MRFLSTNSAPARLTGFVLLLAVLPVAVVSWLGWQLLEQDRVLETQRQHERLENAANLLADTLAGIQQKPEKTLPPDVLRVLVGPNGLIQREGVGLPYYPAVPIQAEAPPERFTIAEEAELREPGKAADEYRRLARSKDPAIRAGALMRLARTLRHQKYTKQALAEYDKLAGMGSAVVFGSPAELVARRQRISLLDESGEMTTAAEEKKNLATILAEGRYALDPVTFDLYSQGLPTIEQHNSELISTVEEWWPRWRLAEPSGRVTRIAGNSAFAAVWQPAREGTLVIVGRAVVNENQEREAADSRRSMLTAGFGIMVVVITAAGYLVFRAVHRELAVATLQSDFVAQVSHEFRTPLTAMRHLTELLEEGSTPPERFPQYFSALGKETRRLHGMVESLLDFGRMESGRRLYEMERTNLSDLVRQVAQEFSLLRLRLDLPSNGPHVQVDQDAVVLALRNLIDNALKYSPETSPVTVKVEECGGTVGLSVQDKGIGIPRQEKRKIFRKFVRGSAARALNVKGTGLGLAAVDQVVRAHGGRLEVESQPGQGSRFTIWVPAEAEGA